MDVSWYEPIINDFRKPVLLELTLFGSPPPVPNFENWRKKFY